MKVCARILLISAWAAAPLSAQDTTTVTPDSTIHQVEPLYRSPKRAFILGSIIPGAGHIYAGEYVRGILTYEFTVSALGMGAMIIILSPCAFSPSHPPRCDSSPHPLPLLLGGAVAGSGLWKWISSARDAPHAAERANAKHRRSAQRPQPIFQPPVDSHSGWRVGAEIHF